MDIIQDKMDKQLNVLLADVYPAIIKGIMVELENNNYFKVVAVAHSLDEIERKVMQYNIDILILDYWFRGVSSQSIIKKLKLKYPLLKIIIYTEEERLFFIREVLAYINGYILKIEQDGMLTMAIQRVLQNKRAISEDIRESLDTDTSFNSALSKQENKILDYKINGLTTTTISNQLCISEKTVRKHIDNARKKLGFFTTEEMMRWFWKQNR